MEIRWESTPPIRRLLEIYKSAYSQVGAYCYTKNRDIKRYMKWLYKHCKGSFIAEINGKIVGFVFPDANWIDESGRIGEIHEMCVEKNYKRRGIGKKLLLTSLEYFRGRKLKRAGLWVGENNNIAINLYKKFGFKEVYKYGKWIRMTRDI